MVYVGIVKIDGKYYRIEKRKCIKCGKKFLIGFLLGEDGKSKNKEDYDEYLFNCLDGYVCDECDEEGN